MKSIKEARIAKNMRVIVRVDMDVPLKDGAVLEPYRLEQSLDTLKYIRDKGGFPVIIGHIGKPDGNPVKELSTKHLIPFYTENLGENTFELLENLRFDPGEEANETSFAKKLAQYGAIFVNDSFAVCHRKHASIVGLSSLMASYAGLELVSEVDALSKVLNNPAKPMVALVGGAKIESKLPTITNLLKTADRVLAGGRIGLEWKGDVPDNLVLPKDYAENQKDIGPEAVKEFTEILASAKTIVWAGPMGMYEDENFIEGTRKVADAIGKATDLGGFSVVGGGDTIAALNKLNLLEKVSFVSTGGGAMLEFLAYGTLPGIQTLN